MVERLAIQYADDDAGFMAEIERMIDEHQHKQDSQAAGSGQEDRGAQGEQAQPDPLAREADRFAAEHADLTIAVTMPDGTVRPMTAAQYLADVRESAAMAREDVALIHEAAQCLLGAT